MQTRSKIVELAGRRFTVRRLPPEVGSFIFMRMLGVSMRAASAEAEKKSSKTEFSESPTDAEPAAPPSGEMQVRALAFSVFSGGMSFEDFKFVQSNCIRSSAIMTEREGVDFALPIVTDDGKWTSDGLPVAEDAGLVTRLTTEVLVHSFADFFENGGLGS